MRFVAIAVCLAVALTACGGADRQFTPLADDNGGSTGADLVCGDASFEEGELASMRSLDVLPPVVLAAVDDLGEPALDTSLDWRVVEAGDDEVVLIRELDVEEPAATSGDTHATVRLGPITGAPNIEDGTWFVWGGNRCSPRLADSAGEDQAQVRLADTPSPGDSELALLVMERRCASGRSAEGRIELDELTVTEDEVRVRLSVRPPPGNSQTCQGNPWTLFTIDLGEPLGQRTVVDANLVPTRELQVGTEDRSFEPEAEDRETAVERALAFDVGADYTLLVETYCACSDGTYQVVVRDGEVVSRRGASSPEGDWLPPGQHPDSSVAPSVGEVLGRLRAAYAEDPDSIVDIAIEESGMLIDVEFTPAGRGEGDEVAHRFLVDVDSPGDPIPE